MFEAKPETEPGRVSWSVSTLERLGMVPHRLLRRMLSSQRSLSGACQRWYTAALFLSWAIAGVLVVACLVRWLIEMLIGVMIEGLRKRCDWKQSLEALLNYVNKSIKL